MKKLIALVTCMIILCACFGVAAIAEADVLSAEVSVSIANKGNLVVANEKITVTDIDNDGLLTLNDALYAAHDAKYDGGAADGYYSYTSEQYGLSLGKLWGDDSGSFGYYKNNTSALSLGEKIEGGDCIYAYLYADTEYWSDSYSYFDKNEVSSDAGSAVSLTLFASGYDADWNPVTVAVEGATITIDGTATEIKTDANGKADIVIDKAGTYVISATSENAVLVPPVCILTVNSANSNPDDSDIPDAGDATSNIIYIIIAIVSIMGIYAVSTIKKTNEN